MAQKLPWKPWHEVIRPRDGLKTGELSLAVFAADLYDVDGLRQLFGVSP